ncbi:MULTISPECIES: glycosyltransferase family 4 protein [Legionella]|uniref:Putative Starch synthase n=1 Tax=Legionella drozanskii LLAP-1 TaxID=1212489 RepID=A0A0W0SM55_9GAMM|nr:MULTISPECIES: glycosyltransferase family 4 protein [Legionella]KTC84253.1 putative Starch synthase [Legionella drozanskii LLAP-1]PJE07195.1 MAG: starch synthase [Legionella sp.]
MRILFINTGPWGTGSFTLVKCLAKELISLGHQVKVFFPDGNVESEDKKEYYQNSELYKIWHFPLQKGSISIQNFPLMIPDPHPRNPHAITFKDLSTEQQNLYENELKKELFTLTQEFKPDVIECHHIWYPAWILKELGLSSYLTAHQSDQMGFRFDEKVREKATAAGRDCKKIIAISEGVKKEVIELYNVDEAQIIVVPNGYDREVFKVNSRDKQQLTNELQSKFGINWERNAPVISFAGKLSLTKGIDILLQANYLLSSSDNIQFLVLGAGSIDSIIQNMPSSSYSLKNMHFVGQQTPEMVAKIHNISTLSLMPSRKEGFGISCLEAMACGLPVVATRCGGPEHFAVGKIIDPESPSQLAHGIQELLQLPKTDYLKLREQALMVANQFTMSEITQKHLKIYEQI